MQLISKEFNGEVKKSEVSEHGVVTLSLKEDAGILEIIRSNPVALMTHGDQ